MRKNDPYNKYEKYIRVYCKCGHSINFLSNHSAICDYCGRKVYPSKKCEFMEKIKSESKKKCATNENL